MTVKLTVNLPTEVVVAVRQIALRRGLTMTEVIRQAISIEHFLQEQVEQGWRLLIERRNGDQVEVLLR